MGRTLRHLGWTLVLGCAGCAWLNKPYASDPLVKRGRAVPGDPKVCDHTSPFPEPQPPLPPLEVIPAPQLK